MVLFGAPKWVRLAVYPIPETEASLEFPTCHISHRPCGQRLASNPLRHRQPDVRVRNPEILQGHVAAEPDPPGSSSSLRPIAGLEQLALRAFGREREVGGASTESRHGTAAGAYLETRVPLPPEELVAGTHR